MVFQNYALYPHMTVYDNLAFGLKMTHVPKDEIVERVLNAAKFFVLEVFAFIAFTVRDFFPTNFTYRHIVPLQR